MILTGDFTDRGKAEGRRQRELREMKKELLLDKQNPSKLDKIIYLLDKQQLEQYGCIMR